MSNIDEMNNYLKRLESNMERRQILLDNGGFICDGTCDKPLTNDDKIHLQKLIDSFKDKSNKLAEAFNELFDTKFKPYPEKEIVEE